MISSTMRGSKFFNLGSTSSSAEVPEPALLAPACLTNVPLLHANIHTMTHMCNHRNWLQYLTYICEKQPATQSAVYRHLAGHVQEQTENVSVWHWYALAASANLGYISVIIIIIVIIQLFMIPIRPLSPGFPFSWLKNSRTFPGLARTPRLFPGLPRLVFVSVACASQPRTVHGISEVNRH